MGTDFVKHYSECLFNPISIYRYAPQKIRFFASEYMRYHNKSVSQYVMTHSVNWY